MGIKQALGGHLISCDGQGSILYSSTCVREMWFKEMPVAEPIKAGWIIFPSRGARGFWTICPNCAAQIAADYCAIVENDSNFTLPKARREIRRCVKVRETK